MTGIYSILVVFVKVLTMLIASSVPHLFKFPRKDFLITFSPVSSPLLSPENGSSWFPTGYVLEFRAWRAGVPWERAVFPSSIRCRVLVG